MIFFFFSSTDLNKKLIWVSSLGFFFFFFPQSGSERVNLSPVMEWAWPHVKDKRRRLSVMSFDLFGSVKPNTKPAKQPHSGLKPQTPAGRGAVHYRGIKLWRVAFQGQRLMRPKNRWPIELLNLWVCVWTVDVTWQRSLCSELRTGSRGAWTWQSSSGWNTCGCVSAASAPPCSAHGRASPPAAGTTPLSGRSETTTHKCLYGCNQWLF